MELKEKIDELGRAFEEFKKTNDQRLSEIATKGQASALTEQKLDKLNDAITRFETEIADMQKALSRAPMGGEQDPAKKAKGELKQGLEKYAQEMREFMRSGKAISAESREVFKKAMSVDSDQDGGFLVSPEMSTEIVTKVFESSPIRQLASVQVISSDSLEIIQDLDEAASGWVGETATRSETNTPVIQKIDIPVHELYAQPKATQKLLDDAAVNLEAWLTGKVAEKFARDEASAFVNGNGVNKPKGILSYASGTSFGQVQRVLTAANNAIAGNDLIGAQSALKEPYQNNAFWLINRLIIGEIRKLKDTTSGQYIWQPGLAQGVPPSLLGRPVMMAADLPSAVTATTDMIMYGDFRAGYQIVDRVGVRVLRDPYTAKGFVLFYTTKRVGGGVKNFEAIKVLRTAT